MRDRTGEIEGDEGSESPLRDAQLLANIRACVASVVTDAGAVIDDPRALQMARDLSEVFADHQGIAGLTRAEALHRLMQRGPVDERLFESRFDLFVRMDLIRSYLPKKHQTRYVLDAAGLVGLLVFERLGTRGGVDEMLILLDTAGRLVSTGAADRRTVISHLRRCRQLLGVYAATLARMVENSTIRELVDEQRHHDPQRVEEQVHELNRLVTRHYPRDHEINDLAFALIEVELRYRNQVLAAVERVLDQGGASLDFSVLLPEQYLTAASTATFDELAQVGQHLVVDPPMPWVDPGALLEAIDEYRPRRYSRTRPPVPTGGGDDDPIATMHHRHEEERTRRRLSAESHLQNADSIELTSTLRALGWPKAAEHLTSLLALAADPAQPFAVELGLLLLVDGEAPVTYLHPVTLRRTRPEEDDGSPAWRTTDLDNQPDPVIDR